MPPLADQHEIRLTAHKATIWANETQGGSRYVAIDCLAVFVAALLMRTCFLRPVRPVG